MSPDRQLKLLWAFLLFSALVCIPAVGYLTYDWVQVRNFRIAVDGDTEEVVTESGKLVATLREVTKEYEILNHMPYRQEIFETRQDFLEFLEDRREELGEIDALLKNARENLDEARELIPNAVEDRDYEMLAQVEAAIGIARRKIDEANQKLGSYRRMI